MGAAIANVTGGVVDPGVASLREVTVAGGLIVIGCRLVAVSRTLVGVGSRLVPVGAGLIAVRQGLVAFGQGLAGLKVLRSRGVYRWLPVGLTAL